MSTTITAAQADCLMLWSLHRTHWPRIEELHRQVRRIVTRRRMGAEDKAEAELARALEAVELDEAKADSPWVVGSMLQRMDFDARIRRHARGGRIGLLIESRDCDGVYTCTMRVMNADVAKVRAWCDQHAEGADGPVVFGPCTPESYRDFEPITRDLVAEAHEDGHRHTIHSPIG
ncbi:hypothetical protein UFOVP703_19 [uncultured Caudovirales phage]|uniref:Uncharacterized protein n=1 Tax=uncultured Caudovirales phage TaxID=2100421 RepID=A0A6J5NLJ4_9CAUD|nr:hypothetical protein UFOVP703_19 [uncultured Caudovirales phage]